MTAEILRVVLDSNIIVSGLIVDSGYPAQVLDAWERGLFRLIMAPELLAEVRAVLRRPRIQEKYGISNERIDNLLVDLSVASDPAPTPRRPSLRSRDEKDDHVLECALGGKAHYLVTGDQDLLVLNADPALAGLQTLTARAFCEFVTG
jgi:putative PIN family toxin of toxin-antitoxin system